MIKIFNSCTREMKNLNVNKFLETHASRTYRKASQKLHARSKITSYMDHEKRKWLMKKSIASQFCYSSLIWMFHSWKLNNCIYELHDRAHRRVYKGKRATSDKPLEIDNSVRVHLGTLSMKLSNLENLHVSYILRWPYLWIEI